VTGGTKELEGYGQFIAIAGFKNVKIGEVDPFFKLIKGKTGDACVQFFDAVLVAGWQHLYFAALNASNAFKNKSNISNSLAVETLLYASAQRQIKEAVRLLGLKPHGRQIAVLVLAESKQRVDSALEIVSRLVGGERDDSVLKLTHEKVEGVRKLFGITDVELEAKVEKKGLENKALTDLVIEHGALLATQR